MRPEELPFRDVLIELARLAADHNVRMLVVGATARDIALLTASVSLPLRATEDVDVAIAVPDSATYDAITAPLRRVAGAAHKFLVAGIEVDVVPVGGVERADRTIEWPDGMVMNTLGIVEAMPAALRVQLPEGETIAVASLPALAALKILAWDDRGIATNGRDAVDFKAIVKAYSDGDMFEAVYTEDRVEVLVSVNYDPEVAGSYWLAADLVTELGEMVASRCQSVLSGAAARDGLFAIHMRGRVVENETLLASFERGLRHARSGSTDPG